QTTDAPGLELDQRGDPGRHVRRRGRRVQVSVRRELTCQEDGSNKFWTLELDGKAHHIHFGKVGSAGQKKIKSFASEDAGKKAFAGMVAEKLKKGYVDAGKKASKIAEGDRTGRSKEGRSPSLPSPKIAEGDRTGRSKEGRSPSLPSPKIAEGDLQDHTREDT